MTELRSMKSDELKKLIGKLEYLRRIANKQGKKEKEDDYTRYLIYLRKLYRMKIKEEL